MQNTLNQSQPGELLEDSAYLSYSYSYPHKTAYRELQPAQALSDVWRQEKKDALFLYIHIPFCEMRCGFCNLFTTTNAAEDFIESYVKALHRQALSVREAVGTASFARIALGGGTPTFLDVKQLEAVFAIARDVFGADSVLCPTSVETSPLTAEAEKIAFLHERGVSRVSMGVQSFIEEEVRSVGRSQRTSDVLSALERLKQSGIQTINVDLIYGIPGQTRDTWLYSLEQAVSHQPEEIYLYPLYVRPMTGLGKNMNDPIDDDGSQNRLALYRQGRDFLLSRGYRQLSMRMFQAPQAPEATGPVYCCQSDGMLGIGCGARSYTTNLHHATRYAVAAKPVRSIIQKYNNAADSDFAVADFGFVLDADERKRRFIIQSLLQVEGLDLAAYKAAFPQGDLFSEFSQLNAFIKNRLASESSGRIVLTDRGLELSDRIGVLLYSDEVKARMNTAALE